MSGQFPNHQSGSAPITLNNYSGWNQPHQPVQGRVLAPGSPQSVVISGMSPQPHIPITQVSGSSPKATKLANSPHNGAGGPLPTSVVNQNASNLSDNLRHNFQHYMNQGSGQPPNSPIVSSSPQSAQSGSMDLSNSPRIVDKEPIKIVQQPIREPVSPNKNCSVISSVGMSAPLNGEHSPRTSTVVSVIANASTSPCKTGASSVGSSVLSNAHQGSDSKLATDSIDCAGIKKESQPDAAFPEKCAPLLSVTQDQPINKVKEEECAKSVSNSVIVGTSATTLSVPSSCAPQESSNINPSGPLSQPSVTSGGCAVKPDALDVESQLEALFAGISDDGNSNKESKPQSEITPKLEGTPNIVAVLESKGSTSKKGKGKANGVCGPSSTESTPKKKRKKRPAKPWEESKSKKAKKGGSQTKSKYVKEASCDSASNTGSSRIRGPVVHIEGTKEAPTSLTIVNAPSRDDEDNESKKKSSSSSRVRKSLAVEGKLSSTGLCGNSLVSRYEAHSLDPRWVCVFCKKGCHIDGLGDLFGPYLINHDSALESSLDLDADMDHKKGKKNKRSGIGQTGVLGLLAIPPLPGEKPQFMVYFHENCAVWSPSINLIGSRLAGVQEAVWVAVRSKCSRCSMDGANIGCVYHGCSFQVHYPCGRDSNWSLDNSTFISACHIHKKSEGALVLNATPVL